MRILKNNKIIIAVLVILGGISCTKNEIKTLPTYLPTDKAFVRFALLSPGTPSVIIKINDVKINGGTTGSGSVYPVTVNFPDYAAVEPNGSLKLLLPNSGTSNDSVVIFTGNLSVEIGKFYAFTLADTGIDRTVFNITDNPGSVPDSGLFKIRLINAMPKSPAINFIRIDSTSATTVERDTIARNISYKSATEYITTSFSPKQIPGSSPAAKYAFLRFRTVTNTGVLLASVTPPATAFNQRSVTTYAYGYAGGVGIYTPVLTPFIYNQ